MNLVITQSVDRKRLGGVKKRSKTIVNILCKESVAERKEVPIRIMLGSDALEAIGGKCRSMLKLLEE
jgi:hypothetical protein